MSTLQLIFWSGYRPGSASSACTAHHRLKSGLPRNGVWRITRCGMLC